MRSSPIKYEGHFTSWRRTHQQRVSRRRWTFSEELVPVGRVDLSRLRPSGPLDPFALYEGYGEEQTQRVLSGLTLDNLKRSAAIVEEQNPGTKPTSRATKKALIDYVMRYVRSV